MRKRPCSPIFSLALMSCLAFSAPLYAETEDAEPLITFSGFGTLGAVHNQASGAAFVRDLTQPRGATNRGWSWETDTRFGVQANFKPADNLEGVVQVVSRYRWENDFKPELTWGFLKYTPNDMFEIRAGRIGFDAFLAADTRDVGFSYLWVRPPVEYYGTLLIPYEDGGDVSFRIPIGNGVSRLKLYTGIVRQQVSSLQNQREWAGPGGGIMSSGSIGAIQDLSGSRITGGYIDYQDNHWTVRLGMASLKITQEFPAGLFDTLGMFRSAADQANLQGNPSAANALHALANDASILNKRSTFKSIALAYEDGPLQTQMAISHMTATTLLISNSYAGYVSAGMRFGKFTPYAVVSAVQSRNSGRDDELIGKVPDYVVSIAKFMLSTTNVSQQTYSIGLRYDVTNTMALKLQADRIHVKTCSPVSLAMIGPTTACSPPMLWTSVPVPWNGRANVFSAVLDFTF